MDESKTSRPSPITGSGITQSPSSRAKADRGGAVPRSPAPSPRAGGPQTCIAFCRPSTWSKRFPATVFTLAVFEHQLIGDSYMVFNIRLQCGTQEWRVAHRFSDFVALHKQLIKAAVEDVPALPPKTWTRSHVREGPFLEQRMAGLDRWLSEVLLRPNVCLLPQVREFLRLDGHGANVQ